uniref:Uncharacterized protein n=1 Tax=Myoviridae sp. ctuev19 TaxID=2827716 RepID=A0A8S5SF38_9CAUD|nr:MAG TPA: hypothetical protein [Myoviridae sp. ctuev19]
MFASCLFRCLHCTMRFMPCQALYNAFCSLHKFQCVNLAIFALYHAGCFAIIVKR